MTDLDGNSHTLEVTASTLYEAVALGLAALRSEQWLAGIPDGFGTARVSVTSIPVEHTAKIRDFTNWIERENGSPREIRDRERVQAILGLSS